VLADATLARRLSAQARAEAQERYDLRRLVAREIELLRGVAAR